VWEGYCEQFSGMHGSQLKCSSDGCRQAYRISYDGTRTEYESGFLIGDCAFLNSAFAFLNDSFAVSGSLPGALSPLLPHSSDTWAAGHALLLGDMLLRRPSIDILLRSPHLAFSGSGDVYILGQRMSFNDAGAVSTVRCSWQALCFSQTLQLVGFPSQNVGCSGHVLAAASANQLSVVVSAELSVCLEAWFSMCKQFSNVTSFCVAPVVMNTPSSRWFQEIVAVNGSQVILKSPGLTFALLPGSYVSSALPSPSQTKSFGLFDTLAAPAVYPIFEITKASQQVSYSPHDTSLLYDFNRNPLPIDPSSRSPGPLSDIRYAAALRVSRSVGSPSNRSTSDACPTVVMSKPTSVASNVVTVRPERAPLLRSCLVSELADGSTTNRWVSEVQLSNHLSMPYLVSAALLLRPRSISLPDLFSISLVSVILMFSTLAA
jgi:hypothetical protein